MRRVITAVAAVVLAVVALSVVTGRLSTGLGGDRAAAAPKTSAAPAAVPDRLVAVRDDALGSVGTSSAPSGGVAVSGTAQATVYRLTSEVVMAGRGSITLYGPATSMTSTSGSGTRNTVGFVRQWVTDAFASSLPAVLVEQDGTRRAVMLWAPRVASGRITFGSGPATSVGRSLATASGVSSAGAVPGAGSGTLRGATLFVAVNAARTVAGCQLIAGTTCDGRDLSRAVLAGADLARASLRGTVLWQAVLHDATLDGADLTRVRGFRSDFSDVTARHATGYRADLTQASLTSADFTWAILDRAKLNRADLTDADLTRASLRQAQAANVFARRASFAFASLAGSTFATADLRGADFRGADLTGVNFDRADLTGADFTGANLSGAVLNRATVTRTVFTRAIFARTKCVDGIIRNHCG